MLGTRLPSFLRVQGTVAERTYGTVVRQRVGVTEKARTKGVGMDVFVPGRHRYLIAWSLRLEPRIHTCD